MRSVADVAASVRSGRQSAVQLAERAIEGLERQGRVLAAVTRVLADRARTEAAAVDAAVAAGRDPGPLAGVPYGVKDLFDVAALPTTAGSALYADAPPAMADAEAVRRIGAAGGVLVATLNMDEFAYGFATINARHGTTLNPHDRARLAGGSSGGSAAVVAAGLLPFSLGSDTNGSIRVPASLTGLYGLKPTHGALPVAGTFPFAASLDDIGPFTRTVGDMELVWRVLGGVGEAGGDAPRLARLAGRFAENCDPAQAEAIDRIVGDGATVVLPDIARARSAAFVLTAFEGGRLHRDALGRDALRFDPQTRDRLFAGALLPQSLYDEALAFRDRFRAIVLDAIAGFDVLLAPATPCVAPAVADPRITIDGAPAPARADLGIHTQPISLLGLPSLAVPLLRPGLLPLGLQLIGRPGAEAMLLALAARLERDGVIGASPPPTGGD